MFKLCCRDVPWVTLILVALICAFNYFLFLNLATPGIWQQFECDKNSFAQFEVWRLFSYMLPHGDISHVLMDVIYLLIIGSLVEHLWTWRGVLTIWFLCGISASVSFLLWDNRYTAMLGSSSATHGLLAFVVIRVALRAYNNMVIKSIAVFIIAYLLYLSLYAIRTGVMGWPMKTIPNSGWDHLGGVIAGVILGAGSYIRDKSKRGT